MSYAVADEQLESMEAREEYMALCTSAGMYPTSLFQLLRSLHYVAQLLRRVLQKPDVSGSLHSSASFAAANAFVVVSQN